MKNFKFGLISICLVSFTFGQLDPPARYQNDVPDFGAVPGTWGNLQIYRPFGLRGIILENWQDLACLNPISGEILNTDKQGWLSGETDGTLWNQFHPALTAPADTTAPSVMVNYKQGEADFTDFTVWYHNSLGKWTRYGWTTKLRSHQRYLYVTPYDEQRHRIQIESELETSFLRLELGYNHQINPLYLFEVDTVNQTYTYNDDLQLNSDRWNGNIHWTSKDSSKGNELFASVQTGIWNWEVGKRQSLNILGYWSRRFDLLGWSGLNVKIGGMSKQLGGNKSELHYLELSMPRIEWEHFKLDLGIRNLGFSNWLPLVDAQFSSGPLMINYETKNLVFDRVWNPVFSTSTIHHLQGHLTFEALSFTLGAWQSDQANDLRSGYHAQAQMELPWMMDIKVGASKTNDPGDWVWFERQINWQLTQEILLFDKALFGRVKLWGNHLIDVNPGILDPENMTIIKSASTGSVDITHLLNLTVSGQVSALILAYTDSNLLQDPLWSQYLDVPWSSDYLIFENQQAEKRFRYFSVIWIFDN
ncbi:MAG: hypothetical protein K9N35_06500 [Candidatus Marinimicrobia bacterium]|nr:hypothetical protein [Candidatus Neomarinimicrobiota bacterium]